jgi:hypothetical protein
MTYAAPALPSLFAVLVLAGCETTDMASTPPAPASLPPDVEITPPAPDVPENVAAFSGIWDGNFGDLDAELAVTELTAAGAAEAVYAFGESPGNWEADNTRAVGQVRGGTLDLEPFPWGAEADFELLADNTLQGTYLNEFGETYTGRFVKRGDL